jgi:hypothetical protein
LKLFSKKSHPGSKKNSLFCVIRSVPDAQRKRNKNITAFIDEDCSYEKDYAECTESENSSEAASLVPQDIFYDPSEEEYDYDNSLHTTSSNLRAQRSYLRKHNPLEYQQSVFDDNPLLAKNFKYNFPDLFDIYTRSNIEIDLDEIKDDNEEYVAYDFDGTRSECPYPSSLTEMKMYILLKNRFIRK